jgi:hypothetical protein
MMDDERDERISQLLLRNAPPERDPLFRVKVLERRERQRYQRSVWLLLGAVLTIAVALTLGVRMGGGTYYEIARAGLFATAFAVAITVYVPMLMRLWRASVGRLGGD